MKELLQTGFDTGSRVGRYTSLRPVDSRPLASELTGTRGQRSFAHHHYLTSGDRACAFPSTPLQSGHSNRTSATG